MAAVKARETQVTEHRRGEFVISTDKKRIDLGVVHGFLTDSYWARGIPRAVVARAIGNSLCFGVYGGGKEVGFARVISDYATYAYIADVFRIAAMAWKMADGVHHQPSLFTRAAPLEPGNDGCSRPLRPMGIYSSADAREIYGAAQPRRLQA
jgi:hypothetical protein